LFGRAFSKAVRANEFVNLMRGRTHALSGGRIGGCGERCRRNGTICAA
jgi:hypothetical protein